MPKNYEYIASRLVKEMKAPTISNSDVKSEQCPQGMVFIKNVVLSSASELPNNDKATGAKLGNILPADDIVMVIETMYAYYKDGPKKRRTMGLPDNFFVAGYTDKKLVNVLKIMEKMDLVYTRYYHGNRYWKLSRTGRKLAELLESL